MSPVKDPPPRFQGDASAIIEFLPQREVGWRCAQRGAKSFGIPAFYALACADRFLISAASPCDVANKDSYASAVCAVYSEFSDSNKAGEQKVRVRFLSRAAAQFKCRKNAHEDVSHIACSRSGVWYLENPCAIGSGWYANVLCHELGHINGWAADHKNQTNQPLLRSAQNSPQSLAYLAKIGAARE